MRQYSLLYMGFAVLPAFVAYGVQGYGYAYPHDREFGHQLDGYKSAWARRLERVDVTEPPAFPGWDDWDEAGRWKHLSPEATVQA